MLGAIQMVVDYIQSLQAGQEQLVLIVGRPGSGKSKIMRELASNRGWKYVDSQKLVTDELLELVPKVRPREAPHLLDAVLGREKAEVILLDGIQLLFTPLLHLEPLTLLRQLSRKYQIVAAWPGRYEGGRLSYLEPGQAEPHYFEAGDLKVIEID
ncbi:MAG: BREX-3 system P-loop-containing protein BrxF [Negativicutes bacterium]|nr:BREX-3 system P-loop-containing protein BrxF [Negativicutes bacterium]